jgi:hypothetical protein
MDSEWATASTPDSAGAPYYGDPFGGDPYGGGYGDSGGSTTSYGRGEQGNLKLKVKPRSAKVYVDGYFVGTVDEFDGSFQKLALNTGPAQGRSEGRWLRDGGSSTC